MTNGKLAASVLAIVPGTGGARLRLDAALSWQRVVKEVEATYGWTPTFTSIADAYRSYEIQERIFRVRYSSYYDASKNWSPPKTKKWDDPLTSVGRVTYYLLRPYATAAEPGTSNHGEGVAGDVTGLGGFTGSRYKQFRAIAAKHGWDNLEGASIGEAWHWVYKPENDRYGLDPVTPQIQSEEDFMSTAEAAIELRNLRTDVSAVLAYLRTGVTEEDLAPGMLDAIKAQNDVVEGKIDTLTGGVDETLLYLRVGENTGELAPGLLDHIAHQNAALEARVIALQEVVAGLASGAGGTVDTAALAKMVNDAVDRFKITISSTQNQGA